MHMCTHACCSEAYTIGVVCGIEVVQPEINNVVFASSVWRGLMCVGMLAGSPCRNLVATIMCVLEEQRITTGNLSALMCANTFHIQA